MMDNLETALIRLFRGVPIQEIISGNFACDEISINDFVQIMRSYSNRYSDTELKNLYNYLSTFFIDQYHSAERMRGGKTQVNVFELLCFYSDWILKVQDNEVVCEYPKFLHWRSITQKLSEDLLVTSFLAQHELCEENPRSDFDWKIAITHNNRELHKILNQGIAENHSHLKGASPVFQLTWVNMMNSLDLFDAEELKRIERNRRNVNIHYKASYQEVLFSQELLQAACIRLFLFCVLSGRDVRNTLIEECICGLSSPEFLETQKSELIGQIHAICSTGSVNGTPDYAITGIPKERVGSDKMMLVFQGERWLMYEAFSRILSGAPQMEHYKDYFYAYLVIKENFRAEIVQSNDSVGFENFSIYEQRKDAFLENPFFKQAIVRKALEASLFDSKVVTSEQRIAPKLTAEADEEYIKSLDSMIDSEGEYRNRFFYTVHFIKSPDNSTEYDCLKCRHYVQRQRYQKQAVALAQMRERYPEIACRVKGIDAANMEIGCGPEVFAQVFRYLSRHIPAFADDRIDVPQLRITYHAGEDFLDLVSGLRCIDEAIHFLGMRCGDRLGHALALGVDVDEWYQGKNCRILLPQQEYLDNIAWMYHLITAFHVPGQEQMKSWLKDEYEYHFHIIYGNAITQEEMDLIVERARSYYAGTEWGIFYRKGVYDFGIETYYSAWKLRGDNPELYKQGFFENRDVVGHRARTWSYYAINREQPRRQQKRYFKEIGMLYYFYHYNPDVRKEGAKTIEKKIKPEFINCVALLQKELQKRVVQYGISIETNPTSNFLIGTFKYYNKHPIIRFYNQGLVDDYELLRECPQLDVSINTDDAGIFSTSLENEYAYMALALEKMKDKDGKPVYKKKNIYTWIDNVRLMGLRQTFLSDEEMKTAMHEWELAKSRKRNGCYLNG